MATASIQSAPTANATCASFFGIGNSADCTSTPTTIAIAIGNGAQARATGLFGAAFAIGESAVATEGQPGPGGAFSIGLAVGKKAGATTNGSLSLAAALGPGAQAETQLQGLNAAVTVSTKSTPVPDYSLAAGTGNLALNLFGSGNDVEATGAFNTAVTVGSKSTVLSAGKNTGAFNTAFSIFSTGGDVQAGPGPFAVAGSILQNGKSISKQKPGFNINGIVVGGAAAVHPAGTAAAKRPSAVAAASHSGKK